MRPARTEPLQARSGDEVELVAEVRACPIGQLGGEVSEQAADVSRPSGA